MAAPIKIRLKSKLLFKTLINIILFSVCFLMCSCCNHDEGSLLCRKCGLEIVRTQDLFSMPSKLALGRRNDTIAPNQRVQIQLFKNPNDHYFEVIASTVANVEADGKFPPYYPGRKTTYLFQQQSKFAKKYGADSWFPGYAWTIAKCPRCGVHMGWIFTALQRMRLFTSADDLVSSFVGLVLERVMHEEEVNTLIMKPKIYHS